MAIDDEVSEAEVVTPDPKTERVTQLLAELGCDSSQLEEDRDLVLEAFEREKVYWSQDLDDMRRSHAIPGPCMAAAEVLVNQMLEVAKDSEALAAVKADEGATEALVINYAHLITHMLGWHEVSTGVCGALRDLKRLDDARPWMVQRDNPAWPHIEAAIKKLTALVDRESLGK